MWKKTKRSTLTTFIVQGTKNYSQHNKTRKGSKSQIGKEEIKLYLFTDIMIVYVENLKDITKEFLELICKSSKIDHGRTNTVRFLFFF